MKDNKPAKAFFDLLTFYVESVSQLDRRFILDALEELRERIR